MPLSLKNVCPGLTTLGFIVNYGYDKMSVNSAYNTSNMVLLRNILFAKPFAKPISKHCCSAISEL